jgi:hypothetical protein
MELDSVEVIALCNSGILQEGREDVQEHDGCGTVIICTRSTTSSTVVGNNRVKMRTCDNSLETNLSRNRDNDRRLRPSLVLDQTDRGIRMLAFLDSLLDLLVEPLSSFNSKGRVEVAVVERGELLKLLLNVLDVDFFDDIIDVGLVSQLVGEFAGRAGKTGT